MMPNTGSNSDAMLTTCALTRASPMKYSQYDIPSENIPSGISTGRLLTISLAGVCTAHGSRTTTINPFDQIFCVSPLTRPPNVRLISMTEPYPTPDIAPAMMPPISLDLRSNWRGSVIRIMPVSASARLIQVLRARFSPIRTGASTAT